MDRKNLDASPACPAAAPALVTISRVQSTNRARGTAAQTLQAAWHTLLKFPGNLHLLKKRLYKRF